MLELFHVVATTIRAIRINLAISGVVALIAGILILFLRWALAGALLGPLWKANDPLFDFWHSRGATCKGGDQTIFGRGW